MECKDKIIIVFGNSCAIFDLIIRKLVIFGVAQNPFLMQDLKIDIVQMDIQWHQAQANIDTISQWLTNTKADIIVLPEMWSSGFTMHPSQIAEAMDGPSILAMKAWAAKYDALVLGSLAIRDDGAYVNRMIAAHPDGSIEYYDKRHLFSLAGEHKAYSSGNEQVIVHYHGWKIFLGICYDLRFPVWSRNTSAYDIAIYVANWPEMRHHAWNTLLKARAIENQCFVVACNRVGKDANDYPYQGGSMLVDYNGKVLIEKEDHYQGILSTTIEPKALHAFRQKLPFLADQDTFEIIV